MSKECNGQYIVEDIRIVKWSKKYMKRYSILFISKAISIGVAKIKSTDNIGKVVRKQSLLHIIVTTIVLEGNYTVFITIVCAYMYPLSQQFSYNS